MAYLRGSVSRGAEKEKDLALPEKSWIKGEGRNVLLLRLLRGRLLLRLLLLGPLLLRFSGLLLRFRARLGSALEDLGRLTLAGLGLFFRRSRFSLLRFFAGFL